MVGTRKRAKLLDSCLEDLQAGRVDEDACRARLEVEEAGLAPLLELGGQLEAIPHPEMRSAALAASLVRVREALARPRPAPARRRRRVVRIAWAVLVLLLALLLATTGTVLAAGDSLPGEPLYPVKRGTEAIRLTLTRRPQARSLLLMSYAERRLDEVAQLCPEGDCPEALLADLEQQTEGAATEIERLPLGEKTELLEKMVTLTERQQEVLTRVLERAPESARPGLERALERSRHGHEQARQSLEREKKAHPQPEETPKKAHTPGPVKKDHTPGPKKSVTPGPKEKEPPKSHTPPGKDK